MFSRRHFQTYFLERKLLHFINMPLMFVCDDWQCAGTKSGYGLVLHTWQPIVAMTAQFTVYSSPGFRQKQLITKWNKICQSYLFLSKVFQICISNGQYPYMIIRCHFPAFDITCLLLQQFIATWLSLCWKRVSPVHLLSELIILFAVLFTHT